MGSLPDARRLPSVIQTHLAMNTDCPTTHRLILVLASAWLLAGACATLRAQDRQPATLPTTPPTTGPHVALGVGEQVPSEDDLIKDLHSLGLINGQTDIFRSACPVRDLAKKMSSTQPSADDLILAAVRTQHLYDLGIRTIIRRRCKELKEDSSLWIAGA
jgi:hypothetical protein